MFIDRAEVFNTQHQEQAVVPNHEAVARVTQLCLYPIKGCRGITAERVTVEARGISGDRAWMLVTPEGRFVTQREHPRMAVITPRLNHTSLCVDAPGMPTLLLERAASGLRRRVTVWKASCEAIDAGDEAAAWFSYVVGAPCRLVRQAPDDVRRVDAYYAQTLVAQLGFADGTPFMLTTTASLDDLNSRLPMPVAMDRFRPNIVVSGTLPYAEDMWQRLRIGTITFVVARACLRCATALVDQTTGQRGHEPLRTLASYRRQERGVAFGQHLIHVQGGELHVGMPLVLEGVFQSRAKG